MALQAAGRGAALILATLFCLGCQSDTHHQLDMNIEVGPTFYCGLSNHIASFLLMESLSSRKRHTHRSPMQEKKETVRFLLEVEYTPSYLTQSNHVVLIPEHSSLY